MCKEKWGYKYLKRKKQQRRFDIKREEDEKNRKYLGLGKTNT